MGFFNCEEMRNWENHRNEDRRSKDRKFEDVKITKNED